MPCFECRGPKPVRPPGPSAVVDLPSCVPCGAAPEKRGEPDCACRGAVLPWELWDELSKRRVELTPVQETVLDEALERARRSASDPASRIRSRIRRVVTLHVSRGHQRVLFADADVGVRAGDTGIANVLGSALVGFRVHENVVESAGDRTAAG